MSAAQSPRIWAVMDELTSAVSLDQRAVVDHCPEVAGQLSGKALTPADTICFIDQVARET